MTCRCTASCNLFCPNGDCLACCSCFKVVAVGIADVVAAKFDRSVYIVNRTQLPTDLSDTKILHNMLSVVNQTWWQVHKNGTYYELPHGSQKEDL
jgi:hypothetical protein